MPFFSGPLLPWLLLGVLLAVGGAGTTGYLRGRTDGRAALEAELARDAATAKEAQDTALRLAADRILQLDIKNTTIRQKTEVVTREVPVYRDCRHDPDALGLLNDALSPTTGLGPAGADRSELPGADPAH